jgi:hypothetical protein
VIVTVTWMDRLQETYQCDDWKHIDGVLYLTRNNGFSPVYAIPVDVNVRIWTIHKDDSQ